MAKPLGSITLRDGLLQGERRGVLVFAGQGVPCLGRLGALLESHPPLGAWVDAADRAAAGVMADRRFRWSPFFRHGFTLSRWLSQPEARPEEAYLTSTAVSQAIIFTTQICEYLALVADGFDAVMAAGALPTLTGHSQGMMAALLIAEGEGGAVAPARFEDYVRYFLFQGLHMAQAYGGAARIPGQDATPMAALSGVREPRLEAALAAFNQGRPPEEGVSISLFNTGTRLVVSGPPARLMALREALVAQGERERERKKAGRFPGSPLAFTWEYLVVGGPFHGPHMAPGLAGMLDAVQELGFSIDGDALHRTVISPADGQPFNGRACLTEEIVRAQFVRPVRWQQTVFALLEGGPLDVILDLGPGDGVARLSKAVLRGTPVGVLALANPEDRAALFRPVPPSPEGLDYAAFAPRPVRLPSGAVALETRYTQVTGHSPIILAGMTPTTVDVGIVAAAANAGFTAELAGGGQVSERIFWLRMEELTEALEPGREIVFNALFLDPYLWELHLGSRGLVQRARRKGYPIGGVTISAGVPELDRAVKLIEELSDLGITHNAFKPGTVGQVKQVLDIARSIPNRTIFLHLEGGKAGGHHSWEDLEELLLATYHSVRAQPNVVLCAGGGVGAPERAEALLMGTWAHSHFERPMPVDAVFLGTVAMACAEATASPQVKRALAQAAGTSRWVTTGDVQGGITSGRSQLGADIHYLDNPAARCGRLLDRVAGDEAAVAAQRGEIIEALNQTAKPYFGDVHAMTWAQCLGRMVELMAVGRHGRYEDGPWPDVTYRERVRDMALRGEERLRGAVGPFEPAFASLKAYDDPEALIAAFEARYPAARTEVLHPADKDYFVEGVCGRPGKPVCFVPVIDANVRRWYKADSLWQAQDARYPAEAVLVIPGPEAVAGLQEVDEPVADLLARFSASALKTLKARGVAPRTVASLKTGGSIGDAPGVACASNQGILTLEARPGAALSALCDQGSATGAGPLGHLLGARTLMVGSRHRPSPIRQLCRGDVGATLSLISSGGALQSARYRPGPGSQEAVVLRRVGAQLRCEVLGEDAAPRLTLTLDVLSRDAGPVFRISEADYAAAIRALYVEAQGLEGGEDAALFEAVEGDISLEAPRIAGYRALTGLTPQGAAPLCAAFNAALPFIFRILCHPELAGGLLELVHLSNDTRPLEAWPPPVDAPLRVTSRLTLLEDGPEGRRLTTLSEIAVEGRPAAQVESVFLMRGDYSHTPLARRERREIQGALHLGGLAEGAFLAEHPWIALRPGVSLMAGMTLEASAQVRSIFPRAGAGTRSLRGQLRAEGAVVADLRLDEEAATAGSPTVLEVLISLLSPPAQARPTSPRTLLTLSAQAPGDLAPFAEVSGDLNPLHTSTLLPRLAGFDGPIVHGMWTAARLFAALVEGPAGGDAARIQGFDARFIAPIPPGADLELRITRRHLEGGDRWVDAVASLLTPGGAPRPAVEARALIQAPTTALVFPGQGIQQVGMGMAAYARSAAARQVWDRADAFTRASLGFSVLHVVRENPRVLQVGADTFRHPQGLLNMTQFTQVAMAVLAQAQVAELREGGALVEDAFTCGHSVGEYNALSAFIGVLPLEDVIEIVYQRGLVMHHLVERDAAGESPYRMGVVRPHYAGLNHEGAEALVARIAEETGAFIQIVNYNIRDRQYSVTGHHRALSALDRALKARQRPGAKAAYIEVPGIDVPFHSRLLLNGVESFRQTLNERFPAQIATDRLLGRYIPNLYPEPFSLMRGYVAAVAELTGSPVLEEALPGWEDLTPSAAARILLIELLAYQFASPVRWIETQERMLTPTAAGGLGVRQLIEVGVGYQPTLANMARYTATLMGMGGDAVDILNAEAQRARVFGEDADPAPEAEPEAEATAAAPTPAAAPATAAPQAAPVAQAGPAAPVEDRAFTHQDALFALLALQAKVRPDELKETETIDALFDGVSSRRNQVLLDIGAEFGVGAMDGAHERPLAQLAAELKAGAPRYVAPGAYLSPAWDGALKTTLSRAGLRRKDVEQQLGPRFGAGAGLSAHILSTLSLETREGTSARGRALGSLAQGPAKDGAQAQGLIDGAAALVGQRFGIPLAPAVAASAGGAVDSAALDALSAQITGPDGLLMKAARHMAEALGHGDAPAPTADDVPALAARLALLEAEHGVGYEAWLAPAFDPRKHVLFDDRWASAQEDIAALCYAVMAGRTAEGDAVDAARALRGIGAHPRAALTARYFANRLAAEGFEALAEVLRSRGASASEPPVIQSLTAPASRITEAGAVVGEERPVADPAAHLGRLWPEDGPAQVSVGEGGAFTDALRGVLDQALKAPLPFAGRTALVTGAGPGSIAAEVVRHLLAGGARVVVTTSSFSPERVDAYGALYRASAGPGAELHVLPFNQASFQDIDALNGWLFDGLSEQAGAGTRVIKEPFHPDLLLPFGALSEGASLDKVGARSLAALRIHLLGVERLITGLSRAHLNRGSEARPCHVVLPLSPNHGAFGGDGLYAETKAALEVLLEKWRSEGDAWGKATTLCGARIGWVRGTGLMEHNDALAAELERRSGACTFSAPEMGLLLAALCGEEARAAAATRPLVADLTGGFGDIDDVGGLAGEIRGDLEGRATRASRLSALRLAEAEALGQVPAKVVAHGRPDWSPTLPEAHGEVPWSGAAVDPSEMIVIVGAGEIGPWGSARTRFEVECEGGLSDAGVMELAWMCGLIRYEQGRGGAGWVDAESGEAIPEHAIGPRYRDAVQRAAGIRVVEGDAIGFDPGALPVYTTIYLEKDLTFPVSSEAEGQTFVDADPSAARLNYDAKAESWLVTRKAGSEIRVPKAVKASRRVLGTIPEGFDFARFGITPDMIERIDRLSLFNLVATVDAFISAGLTPEELMSRIHPTRVGNTQGSGIGGMASLHRLYTDHILGEERHSDVLQETLINVIAAYVVQSYVGSYGVMSHPVGACATAAVSVEEAVDKIRLDKADLVVAGGFDDVGREGLIGFADMNATADSDQMAGMGIPPGRMSRANDRRRRGFVEAQGGGTILLARGDVALSLGLDVLGVVAYAGSFGDGIHSSIPAPGMGALGAASGAKASPLGRALSRFGLSADDIGLVYKHDTSTAANDPNEGALHHRIQDALGRTPGNPLWAVSQKTVTGHPKGGAAAWQLLGLCQSLRAGVIPGNHALECVDPAMAEHGHVALTRTTLRPGKGLKAGLVTSLGFGHVSAMILALHPAAFEAGLTPEERETWRAQVKARRAQALSRWARVRMGEEAAFEKRRHRRFAEEGGVGQDAEEAAMLLNPSARLDLAQGHFRPAEGDA